VSGGYVGVDVFFVISGFLISSHLLRSLDAYGRVNFLAFYARRACRILPASFTVLLASMVGAFLFVPALLRVQVFRDAIATALYVPNYAFAVQGTDYLAETSPSVFQHYWSLGVEEQFYFIWPALLFAAFVFARRSRRWMIAVLVIVVVASFISCVTLTTSSQPWAFFSLWTRAWELGVGGLIAAVPLTRRFPPLLAGVLGWIGLVGVVGTCVFYSSTTVFPGFAAAVPVVSAALVIMFGGSLAKAGPLLFLGKKPLQFLGLISYSLYLVHWPILVLTQAAVGAYHTIPVWGSTVLVAASIPIAWALYRFVENPARNAGWLKRADWRPIVGAGIGSAVLAGLAALAIAITVALPLNAGQTVQASAPSDPPRATSFVPSNLQPDLQHASDDNPSLYADGCEVGFAQTTPHPCFVGNPTGSRIVLFGDSHAAQWYPALTEFVTGASYQLETDTKSACPSVAVEIARNSIDYAACDVWRKNVIANLRADPPALVILSNYGNPEFESASNPAEQWARGMRETISQLSSFTKVAVIADTPDLRNSPIVCLSAHLNSAASCARPASLALLSPGRIPGASATDLAGATFIDLTGYLCTASCPAIIGDKLVYRDSHHITATFSTALGPVLGARVREILAKG
jgi:peptidoglycan/LPS O-acetylase OafA/YrhL